MKYATSYLTFSYQKSQPLVCSDAYNLAATVLLSLNPVVGYSFHALTDYILLCLYSLYTSQGLYTYIPKEFRWNIVIKITINSNQRYTRALHDGKTKQKKEPKTKRLVVSLSTEPHLNFHCVIKLFLYWVVHGIRRIYVNITDSEYITRIYATIK